ncbi:MAG: hypothetical protein ACRBF0_03515 [Calditrichia bacterium]
MKKDVLSIMAKGMLAIFVVLLLTNCSGSRIVTPEKIAADQSVRVFLKSGDIMEGLVIGHEQQTITMVSSQDHLEHKLNHSDIARIEQSDKHFDYQANEITDAEIKKYRTGRNSWVYAFGGAAISGLAGIAVGLPVWYAVDNPPPFFTGGLGAVVGSIYFASRGIKRDNYDALAKVRFLRQHEDGLEAARVEEQGRLKELKQEKESLMKKLKDKKENSDGQ